MATSWSELKKKQKGEVVNNNTPSTNRDDKSFSRLKKSKIIYEDIGENTIEKFFNDADNYIKQAKTDYGDGGYSSVTNNAGKYKNSNTYANLRNQSEKILSYLNANKSNYGEEKVKKYQSYIAKLMSSANQMNSAFEKGNNYYSQWENEDSFNRDYDDYTYTNKYKGYSYSNLLKAKADIEKQAEEDKENDTLNRELTWLNAHKTDKQFADTMTNDELIQYKEDYENKVKTLKDTIGNLNTEKLAHERGGQTYNARYQTVIKELESAEKELATLEDNNGGVLYYDEAGAVTTDTLLKMRENESVLSKINGDEKTKTAYEKALKASKQIQTIDNKIMSEKIPSSELFAEKQSQQAIIGEFEALGYDFDSLKHYEEWKTDRDNYAQTQAENMKYASEHPVLATVESVLTAPLTPFELADNMSDAKRYGLSNIYNDKIGMQNETYQGTVAKLVEDAVYNKTDSEVLSWLASTAYSGVTSAAQSALTTVACTAMFGGAGANVALAVMGTEAAASSYRTAIENGSTNEQAILTSVAAGVGEALFEKIPLDNLLRLGKNASKETLVGVLKSIAKQGFLEGLEEGGTEIWNTLADGLINGDRSAYNTSIRQYELQGYSIEEAVKKANSDWLNNLLSSVVGGFAGGISTGGVTGTGYAIGKVQENQNIKNTGKLISATGGVNDLLTNAKGLEGLSEKETKTINKLSSKIEGKTNANEHISSRDARYVGKLFNLVSEKQTENTRNLVKEELKSHNADTSTETIDVLLKYAQGEKLTETEQIVFDENKGAYVLDNVEYKMEQKSAKNTAKTVDDITANTFEGATENTIENDFKQTTYNGEVVSFKYKSYDTVQLDNGETVSVEDITMSDDDAVFYDAVMGENEIFPESRFVNGELTSGVDIATANEIRKIFGGTPTMKQLKGIQMYYHYGMYNIKRFGESGALTESQEKQVFNLGRVFGETLAEKENNTPKVKKYSKGKVKYNIKSKLNSRQQASVEVIEKLADLFNITFNLYESTLNENGERLSVMPNGEKTTANGYYMNGEIYIDINAGNNGQGAMLYTVAHELTHYIKQWSPKKFKVLADFLVEQYESKGKSVEYYVNKQMEKARKSGNKNMKYSEAFEEFVADSMEKMLTDKNAVEKLVALRAKDKSVFDKLREGIQKIVNRIKQEYAKLTPDSEEGRIVATMTDVFSDIQDLFLEALDDASNNFQKAEKNTATNDSVKYSMAGVQSNTHDFSLLEQAIRLEDVGKATSEEIRQQTGWFRGYDGYWRYEIDDSKMEIDTRGKFSSNPDVRRYTELVDKVYFDMTATDSETQELQSLEKNLEGVNVQPKTLGEIIKHDELFEAYPKLKDVEVFFDMDTGTARGSYNYGLNAITINSRLKLNKDQLKKTLIHEIQHAIQHFEGFSNGASLEYWDSAKNRYTPKENEKVQALKWDIYNLEKSINKEFGSETWKNVVQYYDLQDAYFDDNADTQAIEKETERIENDAEKNGYTEALEKYYDLKRDLDFINLKVEQRSQMSNQALYLKTAGEIESRDVSARVDLNDTQRKEIRPDIYRTDVVFADDVSISSSIEYTEDNKPVVIVENNILEGIPKSQWIDTVKNTISSKFSQGIPISGKLIKVNLITRKEFTNSKTTQHYRRYEKQIYKDKFKSANNLDEIILASTNYVNEDLKHERNDKFIEFARGDVLMRIGNNDYSAKVVVGFTSGKQMVLYDVVDFTNTSFNIKKVDTHTAQVQNAQSSRTSVSTNNSVPQENTTVNNNSMQENENYAKVKFSERGQSVYKLLGENQRLQKENNRLKEKVQYLNQLVKLQRKITHGKIIDRKSTEKQARNIIKSTGSKIELSNLTDQLYAFYTFIIGSDELTWDKVMTRASWIADDIIKEIPQKVQRDEYAQEILSYLRSTNIRLNNVQRAEVENIYDSYNAYRKHFMGSITISQKGTSLDSVWQDLAEQYPDTFSKDINPVDMPLELADIIHTLRDSQEIIEEYDNAEQIRYLAEQIYDTYWDVSTVESVMDKMSKEHRLQINELKEQHAERVQKIRDKHQEEMKDQKAYYQDMYKRLRERANASHKKQMLDYQDKVHEAQARAIEKRNNTETRRQILKTLDKIDARLTHPTKEKNIGLEMQPLACRVLMLANLDTVDADYRIQNINLEMEHTRNPQMLNTLQTRIENITKQGEKKAAELHRKRNKYKAIAADAQKSLQEMGKNFEIDEVISKTLEDIETLVGATPIRRMTSYQLECFKNAVNMVDGYIRADKQLFIDGKKQDFENMAQTVIHEVLGNSKKEKQFIKQLEWLNKLGWSMLKPETAFDLIGSSALSKLFQEARKGDDKFARSVSAAQLFLSENVKKYGADKWDMEERHELSIQGEKLTLTLGEILSLYAYSKREQAIPHLESGGFVQVEPVKKKIGGKINIEYTVYEDHAHRISEIELGSIINVLTKEQVEFADVMQEYLSTVMGAKGNEISRELYQIDLFKEKFYFPLKLSSVYKYFKKNENSKTPVLKNVGMTKPTVTNANDPIVLESFENVWANHVVQMSRYNAYVLGIENLTKVFGYTGIDKSSVRAALQGAYGDSPIKYIENFIIDLNGGRKGMSHNDMVNVASKLVSTFKKVTVSASLSTAIQQPSSVIRAMSYVKPKYFLMKKDEKISHKDNWAELKKYAPIATLKEIGGYDMSSGVNVAVFIKQRDYKGVEKIKALVKDSNYRDEVLMWGASKADEMAWSVLWNAIKKEQRNRFPNMEKEKFLKICGQRFTDVATKTQVYDSVFTRSEIMRSPSETNKMATSFMGEPMTNLNILIDSVIQAKRGKISRKQAIWNISCVYIAQISAAALASVVYAMRDDDDESFYEKYMAAFGNKVKDEMLTITWIPYVRDVFSLIEGYDVTRTDMSVFSDLIESFKNLESKSMSIWDKVSGIIGSFAAAFGLPLKNLLRDGEAIVNAIQMAFDDNVAQYGDGAKSFAEGMFGEKKMSDANEYLAKGKTDKANKLIGDLLEEKTEKYISNGKTPEKAEKDAKSAIRSSLTSYWKPLFIEAYQDDDYIEQEEIYERLNSTGIYGTAEELAEAIEKWVKDLQ